jgi:D-3-phosphoglycerate dehydrogenase
MALLLALARHIPAANNSLKAVRWEKSRLVGVELSGKVLGILGLGKIGREVAGLARAFSMRVAAFDPFVAVEQAQQAGVRMRSLAEVLRHADFVTLHAALTTTSDGTARLIGAQELNLLKPGAFLVNCARGGLIDEAALLAALDQGRLAGAALDVFSQEPIGDDRVLRRLLAHERVIATPHLGAATTEAQTRVALEIARNVVSALRGDTLMNAVSPLFPRIGAV